METAFPFQRQRKCPSCGASNPLPGKCASCIEIDTGLQTKAPPQPPYMLIGCLTTAIAMAVPFIIGAIVGAAIYAQLSP